MMRIASYLISASIALGAAAPSAAVDTGAPVVGIIHVGRIQGTTIVTPLLDASTAARSKAFRTNVMK